MSACDYDYRRIYATSSGTNPEVRWMGQVPMTRIHNTFVNRVVVRVNIGLVKKLQEFKNSKKKFKLYSPYYYCIINRSNFM